MITVTKPNNNMPIPNTHSWMPGYFQGEDVFIVGGGTSLIGFDFSKLEGKRVIAINWSFRDVKPDVLVFLDSGFLKRLNAMGYYLDNLPFRVVTTHRHGKIPPANVTVVHQSNGVSHYPMRLYGGATSAYTAINLAIIGKAKRIILLGIDCGFLGNNKGHYYSGNGGKFLQDSKKQIIGYEGDGTFKPDSDSKEDSFIRMIKGFDKFKGQADIINCSLASNLKCFPKIPFDEIIKEVK